MIDIYSRTELKILWYLKRHGGVVKAEGIRPQDSLGTAMASALDSSPKSINYNLRNLEKKSLVLRHYRRGGQKAFGDLHGFDPLVRVELVDPDIELPPLPPTPPRVVMRKENEELLERTAQEPTAEAIVEALLNRIAQLNLQVGKLQDIVEVQADQIIKLGEEKKHKRDDVGHLTSRIKDALTADQWQKITHGSA